MASNGFLSRAKKGRCQICQRVRDTNKYMKIVGSVSHGYATGYHWACLDKDDCKRVANEKLNNDKTPLLVKERILSNLKNY